MTSTRTAKRVIGGALLLVLATSTALGIGRLGDLWRDTLTGSTPADAFTPTDLVPVDGAEEPVWRQDGMLGRPLDPATRDAIGTAWVEAWIRLDVALRTGDPADLRTSWSGPALAQVSGVIGGSGGGVHARDHDLEVLVFSADGSVAEIVAHDLAVTRTHDVGGVPLTTEGVEQWRAVVRLLDGRWRVDVIRRDAVNP